MIETEKTDCMVGSSCEIFFWSNFSLAADIFVIMFDLRPTSLFRFKFQGTSMADVGVSFFLIELARRFNPVLVTYPDMEALMAGYS